MRKQNEHPACLSFRANRLKIIRNNRLFSLSHSHVPTLTLWFPRPFNPFHSLARGGYSSL